MSQKPDVPTIVARVNSIDFDGPPKHNTLRNKMRLWQAKAKQAGTTKTNHVGMPKRRVPSMPTLPWDKDPSE